jgi:DNA polymerase-1
MTALSTLPTRIKIMTQTLTKGKRLLFDIEADGLVDTITTIHCNVSKDIDTNEVTKYPPSLVPNAIEDLQSAESLIGHNIINYDVPAIKKLYPSFNPPTMLIDTLVLSRLAYPNLADLDREAISRRRLLSDKFKLFDKKTKKLKSAIGSHSLEAWGLRLKFLKGDFGQDTDWSEYSDEMLDYCEQDVELNFKFYEKLLSKNIPEDAQNLEFDVQKVLTAQMQVGWEFDVAKATNLYTELLAERHSITTKLHDSFQGWYKEGKKPAYYTYTNNGLEVVEDNKSTCEKEAYLLLRSNGINVTKKVIKEEIIAGDPKRTHIPFNPASRFHIAKALTEKYNWKPKAYNEDGSAKVSEDIICHLPYSECSLLIEYEIIQDRLEKLKEGRNGGWLEFCQNNRIHGFINSLGAVTARCTHSRPNLAQVPSAGAKYGKECRELFKAKEGWKMLGTDASGLELRCLSHYLYRYDKGSYGEEVVNGDIHTRNQEAAGLASRSNAKTFIYGFLYGAGDAKIGSIVGKGSAEGKRLKTKFLKNLPALDKLKSKVIEVADKRGYIKALDGRRIPIRASYSALNSLLQSCGAIVCKRWMVIINELITTRGLREYCNQVGFIHDELQFEVHPDKAKELGELCKEAMYKTADYYDFKCPLDAEYIIGDNWGDTH